MLVVVYYQSPSRRAPKYRGVLDFLFVTGAHEDVPIAGLHTSYGQYCRLFFRPARPEIAVTARERASDLRDRVAFFLWKIDCALLRWFVVPSLTERLVSVYRLPKKPLPPPSRRKRIRIPAAILTTMTIRTKRKSRVIIYRLLFCPSCFLYRLCWSFGFFLFCQ